MGSYREIVTKAVIGKGKKFFKDTYSLTTEEIPATVLGCFIINHNFKGYEKNGKIIIEGNFDVNVWYTHDDDKNTSVSKQSISYLEELKVNEKEASELSNNKDIIVRALKQPSVSDVYIKDGVVEYVVEKEMGIEVVGDTKVKIAIEENEEPWEIIEDKNDIKETEIEDVVNNIDDEFIK